MMENGASEPFCFLDKDDYLLLTEGGSMLFHVTGKGGSVHFHVIDKNICVYYHLISKGLRKYTLL